MSFLKTSRSAEACLFGTLPDHPRWTKDFPPSLQSPWVLSCDGRCTLCCPCVSNAESGKGSNLASGGRAQQDRPNHWRVLSKPQVRPVLVVVADVFCHQPLQMPFVQNDCRVQQLSSANFPPNAPPRRSATDYEMWRGRAWPYTTAHRFLLSTATPSLATTWCRLREGWEATASRICCTIQSVLGLVTLKRRILRRSCPMTKKQ